MIFQREGEQMYRYQCVEVYVETLFAAGTKDHREIIDRYAKQGYRYVGYVPTKFATGGLLKYIDLIFECPCTAEQPVE